VWPINGFVFNFSSVTDQNDLTQIPRIIDLGTSWKYLSPSSSTTLSQRKNPFGRIAEFGVFLN
jgi:hypothetical protein